METSEIWRSKRGEGSQLATTMEKGVFQVHITALRKTRSKAREDLDDWCRSLNSLDLQNWIDRYIVDEKINLTPKGGDNDNYFSQRALNHLGAILTKLARSDSENLPIREWKNIHLLYLNQFWAKTLKGKNNSLSLIFKQRSTITHKPEITFVSVMDFKRMAKIMKKFSAEREEEEEETCHIETFEDRRKELTTLRECMEKMKAAKELEKKKKDALAAANINAAPEPPPPKKEKPRKTLNIADLFLDDNVLCPIYNEITKKPWCNMITCMGQIVHPDELTQEGINMVVEFFKRHRSQYGYCHPDEFNAWIPFEYSFEDTAIWTDLKIGRNAWQKIELTALQCNYILNHVYSVFCSRNEYSFEVVMNFLAHAVQRPWENCNIMLNIQGPQGIGKSSVSKKIFLYVPGKATGNAGP